MNHASNSHNPLVVDLDGTLIKTDVLWESLILLAKKKPQEFLKIPFWILNGKSFFKKQLADNIMPDVTVLPYNYELIDFLKKSKEEGRKLILASATDDRIVKQVASHLKLFDAAFGTTQDNLKGEKKLEAIKQKCNGQGFDYVGNEKADIPIWQESKMAYVVTNSQRLINNIPKDKDTIHVFRPYQSAKSFIKALRPHQWIKNILLFVPIILAHEITNIEKTLTLMLCFVTMSFCASSVYIINDLLDLEADRHHLSKKNRPFAAGYMTIPGGLVLSLLMLLLSFSISFFYLPYNYTALLALYLLITTLYSFVFKKFLLADVFGLSALYTLRIFAGGLAIHIYLSPWLLTFSSFFFFHLALLKRYIELKEYESLNKSKLKGRNYYIDDLFIILSSGLSSGYISVLIFYLYLTNSDEVTRLYSHPMWLWFIGPLLIYWLTRLWFLAQRKHIDSDPVLFAIKDYTSWFIGVIIFIMIFISV